jgi:hypothetical protein
MAMQIGPTRGYVDPAVAQALHDDPPGTGWITFAATILGLVGGLNVIEGIIGLSRSRFFTADAVYVFSDLRTWAWIVLVLGAIQLVAAVYLMRRNQLARWFGVGAAALNAVGQMLVVQASPLWSLVLFALDVLVIYGLAVHGGREPRAR